LSVWRLEDTPGKENVFKYFRISAAILDQMLVLFLEYTKL
jgi:hypothetical protein